jgi:transcriptional regulator with XRE-family HTH domain
MTAAQRQIIKAQREPDQRVRRAAAIAETSTFGDTLRLLRERRGVSQSKLAERAEFDHSYVSRLESGVRMPAREAVERFGRALDCDAAELDRLLAAAGFLPGDVTSLLSSEPVIGEVLTLLQDETVPAEYRESVRGMLRCVVALRPASRTEAA